MGGRGGFPARCGVSGRERVGSTFSYLPQSGGDAPVCLGLQHVCRLYEVQFKQGKHLSVWFWWSMAGSLSIAVFTVVCPGNSTPLCFSSWTLAGGFLLRYCILSTGARENPPLSIFGMFKARRMLDCSSCTRPPCFAIVSDMVKTYKKLVAALRMRVDYYLDHIYVRSLLKGNQCLCCPLPGMSITTFVSENARANNVMIFNLVDCADKCLDWPWRFPVMSHGKLNLGLSAHTRCTLSPGS